MESAPHGILHSHSGKHLGENRSRSSDDCQNTTNTDPAPEGSRNTAPGVNPGGGYEYRLDSEGVTDIFWLRRQDAFCRSFGAGWFFCTPGLAPGANIPASFRGGQGLGFDLVKAAPTIDTAS